MKGLMVVSAVAAIVAGAACASAAGGVRSADCDANARDSVFAAGGPVYHECAVDRRARITNPDVRIDFTPPRLTTGCYSAEVEFVVAPNGRPEVETAQVRQTNNSAYAGAVLRSLSSWRFEPAMRGGTPVRQIVTARRAMVGVMVRQGEIPGPPPTGPGC